MLKEKFVRSGAIYFEQINQGFEAYHYETIILNERQAFEVLLEKKEYYGEQNAYADFYYFMLGEEAKQRVQSVLTEDEISYILQMKPEDKLEVIFLLTDQLLDILVKLNHHEMLFSTIYFTGQTGKRSTWWGNYNDEYVVFTDKDEE